MSGLSWDNSKKSIENDQNKHTKNGLTIKEKTSIVMDLITNENIQLISSVAGVIVDIKECNYDKALGKVIATAKGIKTIVNEVGEKIEEYQEGQIEIDLYNNIITVMGNITRNDNTIISDEELLENMKSEIIDYNENRTVYDITDVPPLYCSTNSFEDVDYNLSLDNPELSRKLEEIFTKHGYTNIDIYDDESKTVYVESQGNLLITIDLNDVTPDPYLPTEVYREVQGLIWVIKYT